MLLTLWICVNKLSPWSFHHINGLMTCLLWQCQVHATLAIMRRGRWRWMQLIVYSRTTWTRCFFILYFNGVILVMTGYEQMSWTSSRALYNISQPPFLKDIPATWGYGNTFMYFLCRLYGTFLLLYCIFKVQCVWNQMNVAQCNQAALCYVRPVKHLNHFCKNSFSRSSAMVATISVFTSQT